ncbi:hypothetical protein BDD12DRAFT_96976 [Trichophaea hybrida]|nr:hypothetical protein BDD12DRAFT_96976 [Trichophaea hybrida]
MSTIHLDSWIRILLFSASSHCANMNACVLGNPLPGNGILLACDDHRYFFVEDVVLDLDGQTWAVGRYTCGATREVMARMLTLHKMHTRNIDEYAKALRIIDYSQPSIGSIAEKGLLVSIEQQGIPTISGLSHGMHSRLFKQSPYHPRQLSNDALYSFCNQLCCH